MNGDRAQVALNRTLVTAFCTLFTVVDGWAIIQIKQ